MSRREFPQADSQDEVCEGERASARFLKLPQTLRVARPKGSSGLTSREPKEEREAEEGPRFMPDGFFQPPLIALVMA